MDWASTGTSSWRPAWRLRKAFIAASSSDNANIVAARIARNIFRVPRVVARLYDPVRAEVYQRLGLTTISSTSGGRSESSK